ncbi:Leucine-rich repeat protein kinase family protein, putative isoform 2 [Hibiscus syriacus]|uniref:Leucine-rich repeat protein kinase family protein, putative isoform 2 n=1 Tax=Hibiscus syriacus TaxID=106335 RepID=A0A6A2ZAL6_HIBSY|nr:Leucine-rich repeat protein kinase family protein, putative isoform 2 [Hibiscus syriacus]
MKPCKVSIFARELWLKGIEFLICGLKHMSLLALKVKSVTCSMVIGSRMKGSLFINPKIAALASFTKLNHHLPSFNSTSPRVPRTPIQQWLHHPKSTKYIPSNNPTKYSHFSPSSGSVLPGDFYHFRSVMAVVRFLLLLYFIPTLCFSQSDEEALLKLKKSFTNGNLDDWVPGSDPCKNKWVGVQCSGDAVVGFHLPGLQLSGSIDVQALLQIRGLKAISFINNSFAGSIPEFNKLTALRALYLSHNQFSGEIPNDYFYPMQNLKKVWLNNNQFSGKIPDSLMQLPNLVELHLQSNQFSGEVPRLKYPKGLHSLDLSENKLEGEIPSSFDKFDVNSFEGNDGLCGRKLNRDCNEAHRAVKNQGSDSNIVIGIMAVVVILLLFFVFRSKRRKGDDDLSISTKEQSKEDVLPVSVPEVESTTPKRKASEWSRANSSKKGSTHVIKVDLVMVNDEKEAFGMKDLMKADAEVLGNGSMGSAYKAVLGNGLSVVVKKMKKLNRVEKEAFDAEMKRIGKLRHPNILTPLAYHFKKEEKLVVSEYMPKGSLLYVLHGDRGISHANLNWPTRLKVIKGIAEGLAFIHREFATTTSNPNSVSQTDVYCLGILILEIMTGKFPSQYMKNGKGEIDIIHWVRTSISDNKAADLIDPQISSGSIDDMVQLLQIGAACTNSNPDQRLELKEAIDKIHQVHV